MNTKANIFGVSEPSAREQSLKKEEMWTNSQGSSKANGKHHTPDAPRDGEGITIPSVSIVQEDASIQIV